MEGNALDLPFPDSSFDAVTIGYGLRNVVDRHRAMAEICRVLKPGSTLSVLDFNKSINPLSTTVQGVGKAVAAEGENYFMIQKRNSDLHPS